MNRQSAVNPDIPPSFSHIADMLSALVPGFSGGALYDLAGNTLWVSADIPEAVEGGINPFLAESTAELATGVAMELKPHRLDNGIVLFSHALADHSRKPFGVIVVLIRPERGMSEEITNKINTAVKAVAAILSEGYQLNDELNTMANELLERYEELNLIFSADKEDSHLLEMREALEKIVAESALNMKVSCSALIMPDKMIRIRHFNGSGFCDNMASLDKQLDNLYQWTKHTNRSLVINDEKDPVRGLINLHLPCKLISHPVIDRYGDTIGIIASLKEKDAKDFFNSDKNILQVIANKVSTLIQANFDSITGLLNLEAFKLHLGSIPPPVRPDHPMHHLLLYIDLDNLRVINESYGHEAGDEVLRTVGNIIQRFIRDQDLVARIDHDNFGVLLYNCMPERGLAISKRISDGIADHKIPWDEENIQITASIGLAYSDTGEQDLLKVLDDAEIACSIAKEEGKNRISFFRYKDVDHSGRKDEMRLASILQDSLNKNNALLYCQKIQALGIEDSPLFYEVLIRVLDDKNKILTPHSFIPAAERYKLMPLIDRFVIKHTLNTLDKYWETLQHTKNLWSINISGQSFQDEKFLDFILNKIKHASVPATSICFEITETAAIENLTIAQNFINILRNVGCMIALDDFGSGLSSFNYLKNFNIDFLKIDGDIIKDIAKSHSAMTMVKAIQGVARSMKLVTIGEYVENEFIAEQLTRLGVNYGQGYLFGRPTLLKDELQEVVPHITSKV